ncbi:MAG: fibronectin type III domain-containing protein [Candidatus Brocadiaceae bacterium]
MHIGYYDYTSAYLKYATNKTGAWVTTTVDSGDGRGAGEYTSIALDKSDNVHISYTAKYDDRTHYLKYATNKTGVWVTTTVDSDEWVGYFSSIALDKDGNVHISYYDAGNYNLKYATTAKCLPSIPQQPSPIAAVAISFSKIVLTWRDRSCNEKGFKIERKQGACSSDSNWLEITTAETTLQDTTLPEGPWTKIANVGTNIRTYTDEGLSPDTTYAYRVRAYNDIGDSDYSPCTEARTGVAGSPNSPTNLRAVSLSNNRIELSWNDTSANEKRFKIYRRMGSGKWQLNATKGKDATSHTDTNASGNAAKTTYSYYITACNSAGCSPKTNVVVVPYKPKDLKATASSSSQIDLLWIDTSANESGFRIERKDGDCSSANAWGLLATKGWNTTSYSDTELSSGATYAYRINAYIGSFARPYAIGYSAWSNCDHAKTNP